MSVVLPARIFPLPSGPRASGVSDVSISPCGESYCTVQHSTAVIILSIPHVS
jgi:hypothetical protein